MIASSSFFVLVSIIGLILSLYALHVEHSAIEDSDFVAYCDISDGMSCSKVFLSPFGKIFSYLGLISEASILNQPNAFYGTIFYCLVGIIRIFANKSELMCSVLLFMAVASIVLSAYLSFILAFILNDICVLCFSSYVCNMFLFLSCFTHLRTKKLVKEK